MTASDARPPSDETCHCGGPVSYGYDGDPTHHRGMCADCDATRCDADPQNCPYHPARPPSGTGTTGWDVLAEVIADEGCDRTAAHARRVADAIRRRWLLLDPAEARETIARVLCFGRDDSEVAGWWDRLPDSERNRHLARADAVLAALAAQGQP